jgi:hypothetical protein
MFTHELSMECSELDFTPIERQVDNTDINFRATTLLMEIVESIELLKAHKRFGTILERSKEIKDPAKLAIIEYYDFHNSMCTQNVSETRVKFFEVEISDSQQFSPM